MREEMMAPESFETTRLILRKPTREDAALIFETYGQDAEVTRYLMWRPHTSVRDAQAAVERFVKGSETGMFHWLIFLRDTGELAGSIAVRKDANGAHLGYLVARSHWGRGLIGEAIAELVRWSFDDPSIFRVWAVCDVENRASARVLERAGFLREGTLKKWSLHPNVSEVPRDCHCYAKTRAD